MALNYLLNFLAVAQQENKKKKNTEVERIPQEHAVHFFPEVHVVDEATTEELTTSWQDVENEMDSKE